MSARVLNVGLLVCLSVSSVFAEPPPRGKSPPKASGEPAEKLSDEQELILASSGMRREVRDYLKRELKRRDLPEYKLAKGKRLNAQALEEYTTARGDRKQLLTLIAGHLQVAQDQILPAYVAFAKDPQAVSTEVLEKAREAIDQSVLRSRSEPWAKMWKFGHGASHVQRRLPSGLRRYEDGHFLGRSARRTL